MDNSPENKNKFPDQDINAPMSESPRYSSPSEVPDEPPSPPQNSGDQTTPNDGFSFLYSSDDSSGTPPPPDDPTIPPENGTGHVPWLTVPDVKPDPDYNPYREDLSIFNEIYTENPSAYRGSQPLEGEDSFAYNARRGLEYAFTNRAVKKKLRQSSNFISLLVLMFVVLGIGLQIPMLIILGGTNVSEQTIDTLNYILMALQYLIIFPVIFLIGTLGRKNKCRTFFQKPQTSKTFTFRWCVISLGVTYIVAMVFDSIFSLLKDMGMYVSDLSTEVPTTSWELALYFLFTVICAPLFEEIMFRGIMLTHYMKYGCIFASVITGVLFGLIHQNHEQMFFAAALGIIFAIIDIRAGSIIPSLLAHLTVNGFSFINSLLASQTNYNDYMFGDAETLTGPDVIIYLMGLLDLILYASMFAAVVLLIIECIKFPQTFRLPAGDSMLDSHEKTRCFFSSPVTIITLIALAAMIAINSFIPFDAIQDLINSIASYV